MAALKDSQLAMARYLRDPHREDAPDGIEPRRLKIYENLVYNNIESFLTSGFPVLYSLYQEEDWRELVRAFMQEHRCQSPYFLEISQEFLQYLLDQHPTRECDPPFMRELAHYEWVEIALDVSQEVLPEGKKAADLASAVPRLSPLAWSLAYAFPVHRIGSDFQPTEAGEPTFLVVYRDREDRVRFMEVNAATSRLLEMIRDNTAASCGQILSQLAPELGLEVEAIRAFALEQIEQFIDNGIVWTADA